MVSSLIILVLSLVGFAAVHSLMASLRFKRLAVRVLGFRAEALYMHIFNIMAFLTISPLAYLLYKDPGQILYIVPSPWRWVMVSGQLIAGIITLRAFIDAPQRFKIRAQLSAPKTPEAGSLNIHGIYRWVRDPFLFSGLIVMVLTPFMTVNLLVIYFVATIYLYLGSRHWETRLVAQFGDEYREYQKQIHRVIPKFKYQDKSF